MRYTQKTIDNLDLELYILGDDGDLAGEEIPEYVQDIHNISGGWLGFNTPFEAEQYLTGIAFDDVPYVPVKLDYAKVTHAIEEVLEKVQTILPIEEIDVVVIPTIHPIVLEKFNGVAGYTSNHKTILLNLAHDNSFTQKELKARLAQMFNHLFLRDQWKTLLDSIINEGLAMHFAKRIVKGYSHPYESVLTEGQQTKILGQIKQYLNSSDQKAYDELFLGEGEFPFGAGYAIGYKLVEMFQEAEPTKNWQEIMQLDPHYITVRALGKKEL
jgi:uncharacterized protein YjaZ